MLFNLNNANSTRSNVAKMASAILIASSVFLTSCMSNNLNYEMGSSVNQMLESQFHNPTAVANPVSGIAQGMDGSYGEGVINSYREANTDTSVSSEDAEFSVGKD